MMIISRLYSLSFFRAPLSCWHQEHSPVYYTQATPKTCEQQQRRHCSCVSFFIALEIVGRQAAVCVAHVSAVVRFHVFLMEFSSVDRGRVRECRSVKITGAFQSAVKCERTLLTLGLMECKIKIHRRDSSLFLASLCVFCLDSNESPLISPPPNEKQANDFHFTFSTPSFPVFPSFPFDFFLLLSYTNI